MWSKLFGVPLIMKRDSGFVSMSMISEVIISLGMIGASSQKTQFGWNPLSLSGEHGSAISFPSKGGFSLMTVWVVPGRCIIRRIRGFDWIVK